MKDEIKLNNLSLPPGDEPWKQRLSRIFGEAIPFLIPATTAFFLWLAKRKENSNRQREEELQRELTALKQRENEFEAKNPQISFQKALHQQDSEYRKINQDLDKIAEGLKDRQDIFCSVFKNKVDRLKVEKHLLDFGYSRPYDKDLTLYKGLKEIFEKDTHCGNTRDENGCMMWTLVDLWRAKAKLLKFEKASAQMQNK
ncbi:coiled-coil domain-containing protein 127-like [Antedon mediterranea]|uniref:coiled-coil domain-containing protein 127-like n=1 Tax=Antedon mediterranea TaxID=105859 RepID=UPI003AF79136